VSNNDVFEAAPRRVSLLINKDKVVLLNVVPKEKEEHREEGSQRHSCRENERHQAYRRCE